MMATGHQNVVTFYGKCEIEGRTAIVMEVWGTDTLKDVIKEQREVMYKSKKIILRNLLAGLNHLHKRGIIHR